MVDGSGRWDGDGGNEASDSSKSKNQEGRNKGRAKIKRGRTKRKSFLLHNLGDAFRWNPDANLPKNLK